MKFKKNLTNFHIFLKFNQPALRILLSDSTPLKTGPMTNEELSWIGSVSCIGSICGALICGVLSALLGSKRAMAFLALPAITFWLLIHFGDTLYHIFIARFAAGLAGGGFQSILVLYVSEISNDK